MNLDIPPSFWAQLSKEEFSLICEKGKLDEDQCRRLWEHMGKAGSPPLEIGIMVIRDDMVPELGNDAAPEVNPMRLPRPYIPMDKRLAVAERQLRAQGKVFVALAAGTAADRLKHMLQALLGEGPYHLDHDPPLMLRVRTRLGGYKPEANDPDYLIWRTADDHRLKTFVRGDGAQLSDAGKRRKEIKRRKKATRPKYKWPSRPMRRPP